MANLDVAQQVINGTYVAPPGTPLIVFDFLSALKRPNSIRERNEVSLLVTEAENKERWKNERKKQKELQVLLDSAIIKHAQNLMT